MKRALRTVLFFAVCALLGGGCATSAMKGTPFYTGEYKKRLGAPEDRVNMWPVLYYRDPALSVLWPLMELSDEHFAIRPVMSVHGLGEEKKVYNMLWPLGQVNQRTGDHRFFPVFWGEDYCHVFPLYWHYGGKGTKTDALFPAWVIRRRDEKYSYHFAWPLIHFKDWGEREGWRVWPVAGHYRNYSRDYSFYAWPLGHLWKDQAAERSGSALFPLYCYERDADSREFFSLPYSFARGGAKEWDLGLPLFYREQSGDGSKFISPLYLSGRNRQADRDWQCLVPFYYKDRNGDRELFGTLAGGWTKDGADRGWAVIPALSWGRYSDDSGSFVAGAVLGHRAWDGADGSSHILPLYYHRKKGDKSVFISLPYSGGTTKDGSWKLVPPLYYGAQTKKMKTLVTPLYARGKALTDEAYWSALMPFYYRDGDAGSSRTVTLAAAWSRDGDKKSWIAYPLLSGGTGTRDSGEVWLAGPLFHRQWDSEGSQHHLFPLYYRDSKTGTFVSLPYASWKSRDGRTTRVIPPVLGAMTSGNDQNDLWGLAGLVHASWGRGETPHHFIPFYYSDPGSGRFLSLPYCSQRSDSGVRRIVPPLLSSYEERGERRRLNALLGLSSHEWGGKDAREGYVFPLYSYKGEDHFYTPLFGWKKSERNGFVYPLTPLLGIRKGEDRGGWLFPLFSYKRDQSDNVSGTYLWGGYWKNERNSGSGIFPIYSYKNHGAIDDLEDNPSAHDIAGKEFVSLPFCWYKNKVRTWPVYENGKKTDKVRRMARKENGFFPVWSYSARKNLESGRVDSGGSLLLWLFDSKYENRPETDHEYVRKRVLWRLYHYERLNGDVSVDAFPFITYDKRKDGGKSFSFMWRLFSYRRKESGVKVHILFIPFGKGK